MGLRAALLLTAVACQHFADPEQRSVRCGPMLRRRRCSMGPPGGSNDAHGMDDGSEANMGYAIIVASSAKSAARK